MKKNKRKHQYLRRTAIILRGLSFEMTTPSPDVHFGISTIGNDKGDRVHYEFKFKPPLEKTYAATTIITVTHIESKRTDTRIVVLPPPDQDQNHALLNYIEFTTHTVKLHKDSVDYLYVCLLNTQVRGDVDTPIWVPKFNYNIGFFPKLFPDRFESLPFYPPNVDMGSIDLTKIPNMTPIRFKPYGGVTGSQFAKLLGYYATTTTTTTSWQSAAMRFGIMMEPIILMLYLSTHPDYSFKEPGWWPYKDKLADGTWTDGIITDGAGNTFGVECKASASNCNFEGSHIAQCIWTMACGDTPFQDLVKYGETQVRVDNEWSRVASCKETRIHRHLEKERELIELAYRAKSHPKFHELIQTPPYVNAREYLDDLANKANSSQGSKNIEIRVDLIQQFHEYRQTILDVQDQDCVGLDPVLDRIEKRQARLFALYQEENKAKFHKEVCDQIRDYSDIIKKNF